MKILIISQYFPPENAAIPATLARSLTKRGHQVRVLTGYPNYPEGELFDGYRQRWRTRESDGRVEILRVPLWIDHSQNAVRRTLNYASFGLSATTAYDFARDADVIYVYATQMTPALAPWLWRIIGGAPYVLHVQDLWPDSITGSSLVRGKAAGIVNAALTPWLASVYRRAAAVVGIAPTMVQTLIERGVDASRAHMVYNWADEPTGGDAVDGCSRDAGAHILYAGNVGDMQDLETAVLAAHQARDAGVTLTIVGDGVALPRVRALAEKLGVGNVTFLGRVPPAQMGAHYRAADFALVTLKDLPAFGGTIPSKLQGALSYGKPIVTTVQGDVRALVEDLGVGFTADAEDADALASAFRRAAALGGPARADMAVSAKRAYTERFSLGAGVGAVEQILQEATGSPAPRMSNTEAKGSVHAVG